MKKLSYDLVICEKEFKDSKGETKKYTQLSILKNGYLIPIKSIYKNNFRDLYFIKEEISLKGKDYSK